MNGKPDFDLENDPLEPALRKLAAETHPRAAFTARLRGELASQAARPRRRWWLPTPRSMAQAGLAALLLGLVALAMVLAPQTGWHSGQLLAETGTPLPGQPVPLNPNGLPNGALARLGKGTILTLDTAVDGRLAVGSTLGLCVYTSSLEEQWCMLNSAASTIGDAQFDPSGEHIAVIGQSDPVIGNGRISVLDAASGAMLAEREIHSSWVSNIGGHGLLAWDPTGRLLALSEDGGSLSAWDWQAGSLAWGPTAVFTFPASESSPVYLSWARGTEGESILAAGGQDGLVLLDGASGAEKLRLEPTWEAAPVGQISALAFSPDNRWLAYAHPDGIMILSFEGWQPLEQKMWPLDWQPSLLAWGRPSDGQPLAYDSKAGIQIQALDNDQPMHSFPARHGLATWNIDGGLVYARTDGMLGLSQNGEEWVMAGDYTNMLDRLAWKNENELLSLPFSGRSINTWDAAAGKLGSVATVAMENASLLALSPDGAQTAYYLEGQADLLLWDTAANQPLERWQSAYRATYGAFSADGSRLITTGPNGQIIAWDSASGRKIREINAAPVESQIDALALSPSGVLAALAWTEKGALHLDIWDLERGEKQAAITPSSSINALAFSPDGTRLASASSGDARLWDARTGLLVQTMGPEPAWMTNSGQSPVGTIHSLAFSPDGRTLATGGRQVTFWNLNDGLPTMALSGHSGLVDALAFRADGKVLASGSWDGSILLWDLGSGPLIDLVQPTATPLPLEPTDTTLPLEPTPTPLPPETTPASAAEFDPALYDTRAITTRSPDGSWTAEVLWGGVMKDSPRREDFQRIVVRGPQGQQWQFEQWTEAETQRTNLSELKWWPLAPEALYWYENVSTLDECHRSWATNLRRMDLANGQVSVVEGFGPEWRGRLAFSPDTPRIAFLDGTVLVTRELGGGYEQRIEFTPIDPNSWGVNMLLYLPENAGVMMMQHRPNNVMCDGGPVQYALMLADLRTGSAYQRAVPDGWNYNGYETVEPGGRVGFAVLTDPQGQHYRMDMASGELTAGPLDNEAAGAVVWHFLNMLAEGASATEATSATEPASQSGEPVPEPYGVAAADYGGSLEELIRQAPEGEPQDAAALLRWACERGGYVCLPPQSVGFEQERDGFIFQVRYRQPDGSEYSDGQHTSFSFHVKRGADGPYRVMSLPPTTLH